MFQWIPSNYRIKRNDEADRLAKEGTLQDSPTEYGTKRRDILGETT